MNKPHQQKAVTLFTDAGSQTKLQVEWIEARSSDLFFHRFKLTHLFWYIIGFHSNSLSTFSAYKPRLQTIFFPYKAHFIVYTWWKESPVSKVKLWFVHAISCILVYVKPKIIILPFALLLLSCCHAYILTCRRLDSIIPWCSTPSLHVSCSANVVLNRFAICVSEARVHESTLRFCIGSLITKAALIFFSYELCA